MTEEEVRKLMEAQIARVWNVVNSKGKIYGQHVDRLAHFHQAGAMQKKSAEEALMGMVAKHDISLVNMCQEITNGKPVDMAEWEEKITDSLVYRFLLDALVRRNINGA